MQKYQYTKVNHFADRLNKFQGKSDVPSTVIDMVSAKLIEYNAKPTRENIREILRNAKLKEYYEDIPALQKALDKNTKFTEEIECPICMENTSKNIKTTCNHSFCEKCFYTIANDNKLSCPLCRRMIDVHSPKELTKEEYDSLLNTYIKSINEQSI